MAGKKTQTIFGIKIDTGESTPELSALDKELNALRDTMAAGQAEVAAMTSALQKLERGGFGAEKSAVKLRQQIEAQNTHSAAALDKYVALGGKLTEVAKRAEAPAAKLSTMSQVMKRLHTEVMTSNTGFGRLVGSITRIYKELDASKVRAVAMTGALVGLTVAAAAFTKSMFESAVAAQDARRNELLHLEALTRVRNLYGLAAGSSKDMQAQIDKVSASVSISRGEVAQLAAQIYRGGARGAAFGQILEAASIKASALGSAAGSAFAGFANDVRLAGGSAARAAQDVKNRFGDVVQAKLKSIEVQALKTKENVDSLFSGLDIEPLLTAKKRLNDMFSQATASGRAFHSLATTFLQPILDGATSGLVIVRRFFKQMLIGALELVNVYLMVRVAFHKTFGGPQVQSVWGKFFNLIQPGRLAVYILAVAFGYLAVSVIAATWPFVLGAVAVWGLIEVVQELGALFNEIDWSSLGKSIVNGIVEPIIKAEDWIVEKVSALGTTIKNAFADVLQIHSPSKVFAELGLAIPQGVVSGIKAGEPDAKKAASGLVDKPIDIPSNVPTARAPQASGGRGGNTITIAQLNITPAAGTAAEQVKEIGQSVRRELETVLAGLAEQIGAPRTGAAA